MSDQQNSWAYQWLDRVSVLLFTIAFLGYSIWAWRHATWDIFFKLFDRSLAVLGLFLAFLWSWKSEIIQKAVAAALPTQFVGTFPRHIDAICKLVKSLEAGDTLCVLCDVSDYGSFFDPQRHKKLYQALIDARDAGAKFDIRIIEKVTPFTQNCPLAMYADEVHCGTMGQPCKDKMKPYLKGWIAFLRDDEVIHRLFDKWRNPETGSLYRARLYGRWRNKERQPLPEGDFLELLNELRGKDAKSNYSKLQKSILNDGLTGWQKFSTIVIFREYELEFALDPAIDIKRVPAGSVPKPPVFTWMKVRDENREAIFLFNDVNAQENKKADEAREMKSHQDDEMGRAFRTRDITLTEELYRIFCFFKDSSASQTLR